MQKPNTRNSIHSKNPSLRYLQVMQTIRLRFDTIKLLRKNGEGTYIANETTAFHARKIVEGISYGCLVALDHAVQDVPRDIKKRWNADLIFKKLKREHPGLLPMPIKFPPAVKKSEGGSNHFHFDADENDRLSYDDLMSMYQRLHFWAHEINPYVGDHGTLLLQHIGPLRADIAKLEGFLERHVVKIAGKGFFCVLHDMTDDQTKVLPFAAAIAAR
jgi:hypothetical protein